MRDDKELILDLEEMIKIYERALQYYGDPANYGDRGEYWKIVIDAGKTARRALKEAAEYGQEKETE